jgi:pullulanase
MGKWFVAVWAFVVVGTIAGMQMFMFDRSLGKPHLSIAAASNKGAATNPLDDLKKTADEAAKGVKKAAEDAKAAAKGVADAVNPNMVQPEELAQGFIVVVTDKTKVANTSSPIYMPNSHNGWNPSDPKVQLQAQSDMKWRLVFEKPKLDSRIAFKFARGAWEKVETAADFKDISDRMLPKVDVSKLKDGEKPVIELEVAAWKDQAPEGMGRPGEQRYRPVHVSAGRLERVEVVGGGVPGLNRDVLVWLPPGYDDNSNKTKMYPVLYMQDGQNVFDKPPTAPAEWMADETAARLIAEGKIEAPIIVAVPHAGGLRAQEYLPIAAIEKVEPKGREYVAFLVNEVKPKIDRLYRVKSAPENTAIGGSSLGAIISMEAATERPDVFGKVIAESMPLVMKNRMAFSHFASQKTFPKVLFIGMGGKEASSTGQNAAIDEQYVAGAQALQELAQGKGSTVKLVVDGEGKHEEAAWAKRFGAALEFVFPAAK